MFNLWDFIATLVAVILFSWFVKWSLSQLPLAGPFQFPLLGNTFYIRNGVKEPHIQLHKWHDQWGPTYLLNQFSYARITTRDPLVIKQFLFSDFPNYEKGPATLKATKPLFGSGIFAVNDEEWQRQRAAIIPLFHHNSLSQMVPILEKQALRRITSVANSREFDIQMMARALTLATFLEAGVGISLTDEEIEMFGANFDYLNLRTSRRVMLHPFAVLFPDRQFDEAKKHCRQLLLAALQRQQALGMNEEANNVINRFAGCTNQDVFLDIIMNFILAGRDTTAALITFTCWMLTLYPDIQDKIVQELCRHGLFQVPFIPLTSSSLGALEYLHTVLKECLRLFPPVPLDAYEARQSTTLTLDKEGRQIEIPKGVTVMYNSYSAHRQEEYFGPSPDTFDPSRWETIKPPPFAFIPFHAGPRTCLGVQLAYLEAKSFFVTLLRRYRIVPTDHTPKAISDIRYQHQLVLGIDGGMPISFEERDRSYSENV